MLPFRIRYFAHRGLHGDRRYIPENSLPAFRAAVEAGYGMELDVQLTKDGQVVVFHDDTLDRVCGVSGMIEDYTYEELQEFHLYESQEKIPLFRQVLEIVDGRTPLIVEIKAPKNHIPRGLCQKTADFLDRYDGEYCIESFHPMIVYWFKVHRPHVYRGQLCTDYFRTNAPGQRWQFVLMETMAYNFLTKPHFIAYDIHYKNAPFFRLWKRKITAVAWTIRSKKELEENLADFDFYIMERVHSS